MYLYLGEPADRLLRMRLLPLAYGGSPRQSLAVYLNGTLHDRLTLDPGWARYELKIPARLFRPGLNGLTFKYGAAASPARVMPGSDDTRTLAMAFTTTSRCRGFAERRPRCSIHHRVTAGSGFAVVGLIP